VLSWTVLGGSPAWPNPGQAASGYLLESEERRMLIDCGSGIAQELRAVNPPPLTDILITHFHADHWFDLVPLHYAFRYGSWRDILTGVGMILHEISVPPSFPRRRERLTGALGRFVYVRKYPKGEGELS